MDQNRTFFHALQTSITLSKINGNIYILKHKDSREQGKKTHKPQNTGQPVAVQYNKLRVTFCDELKFNIKYTVTQVQ